MQAIIVPSFKRKVKKLHSNAKAELDIVIRLILADPTVGERKRGNLGTIYVYKFMLVKQLTLLAYTPINDSVLFIAIGSHENFYRDLKNVIN